MVNSGADEMGKNAVSRETAFRVQKLLPKNSQKSYVRGPQQKTLGLILIFSYNQPVIAPPHSWFVQEERKTTTATVTTVVKEWINDVRSLDKKGMLLHISFAYSFWVSPLTFIAHPQTTQSIPCLCNNQHRCIQNEHILVNMTLL